jgi:hypothetical protein
VALEVRPPGELDTDPTSLAGTAVKLALTRASLPGLDQEAERARLTLVPSCVYWPRVIITGG